MEIVRAFPQFSGGNILRNEMLLSLRGYAELGDLLYEGYGDGILSGCKLTTTRETIEVGRGVIVYKGKLLMLKEPIQVPYYPTDTLCACKLVFSAEHIKDNVLYQEVEAVITEDVDAQDGIELCRFTLQPGAILRSQYVDFEDRSTEYDTLNTIYSPFSVLNGNTLSLSIIRIFAFEMLKFSAIETMDKVFCMQVLGAQQAIPLDSIFAYVSLRIEKSMESASATSNYLIYEDLLKILKHVKLGIDPSDDKKYRPQWKLNLN